MSAENRHTVAVHGETFAEMCRNAADIFDAYFGRKVPWSVTYISSEGNVQRLDNGVGQAVSYTVTGWVATFEAKCTSVRIGMGVREPAIWFST